MAAEGQSNGLWYADTGDGEPLVLLHPGGAGVDARALRPQVAGLSGMFRVLTPEQRAHGRSADIDGPLSYETMARDTAAFITNVIGGPVRVAGVSDGAIVALTLARRRPDLVDRLVHIAAPYHHHGWHDGVLDGEPPEHFRRSYAELSPDGPEHYDVVVEKLAAMHAREPTFTPQDLRQIRQRTLIMVSDDDEVRFEHTIALYDSLPHAELAVIPGTSHGLLVEKPEICNQLITAFLSEDPVPTFAPIRRRREMN